MNTAALGNDKNYLLRLKELWDQNGINVPYYTVDGPTAFMLEAGSIPGAAQGLDSGGSDADFAAATRQNPDVPSFSSESYPGWLTHWGEKWARPGIDDSTRPVRVRLVTVAARTRIESGFATGAS